MHKESFYQFILYTLLQEGKSNIPFKIEVLLLGKQLASKHYFIKLYKGCDIPSFFHIKKLFEKEYSYYLLDIKEANIQKDENGLMTGNLEFQIVKK